MRVPLCGESVGGPWVWCLKLCGVWVCRVVCVCAGGVCRVGVGVWVGPPPGDAYRVAGLVFPRLVCGLWCGCLSFPFAVFDIVAPIVAHTFDTLPAGPNGCMILAGFTR